MVTVVKQPGLWADAAASGDARFRALTRAVVPFVSGEIACDDCALTSRTGTSARAVAVPMRGLPGRFVLAASASMYLAGDLESFAR